LGLGTWGLSGDAYGPVSPEEQERVIRRALALGITLFETADCYGRGRMETLLARVLGENPNLHVVTKIGTMLDGDPPRKRFDESYLDQAFDAVLRRMAPRRPDVVLLHNPSTLALSRGSVAAWFERRIQAGQLRSWGVSAGSKDVAKAAIGLNAPVLELAFNPFWPDDFRAIEQEARERGTAILGRSILAHGLLAGFWPKERTFGPGDHRAERWTSDELRLRISQLDALRPLLSGSVSSLRAVALRWALTHELLSSALLGPRSCLQLDQLVREAGKAPPYLPPEALGPLETRLHTLGVRP
jgi:aryl-alcohol dehydrogenase-like predicted oxidoreductase